MTVELPSGDKALPNNKTVRMKVYDAGYMTIQIGANEHQTLDMDFPTVSCDALKLRDQNGKDLLNVCTNYGASNLQIRQSDRYRRHVLSLVHTRIVLRRQFQV